VKTLLLPTAVLCALLSAAAGAANSDVGVQATDAWIRWLPADIPSGAYLTLTNSGSTPRVLVSAVSPDFGEVSFHLTHTADGMSEMSAVGALTISPRSRLQFAPGGYHIMLMQPLRTLHPGDHVPITLQFADGSSLQVSFAVRGAT
jgi:copper(I)-binding protein